MVLSGKMKNVVDVFCTVLLTVAAAFVLWTQIEDRWLRPTRRPQPQDVKGLTIEATKVRHTKGAGTVALVEFTDYECPFCGRHARDTAPAIDKKLVEAGTIRHVVFNFPLEHIHPKARRASEAAECAARQGRYWEMHQQLFSDHHDLGEEALARSVAALGLDGAVFTRCLAGEAAEQISADVAEGKRLGVNSTPTFFVGVVQADGSIQLAKRVNGAVPFEDFQEVVGAVTEMSQ